MKILTHRVYRGLSGTPNGRPVRSLKVSFRSIDDVGRFLRRMVVEYRQSPVVRRAAIDAITAQGAREKDKLGQAIAIATWVKQNIYYVHEANEVFQTPEATLREKSGDCDDFTTLQGSMMESIGIPAKMNLMRIGMEWKHIYPSMVYRRSLLSAAVNVPLDATLEVWPEELPSPTKIAEEQGKGAVYVLTV